MEGRRWLEASSVLRQSAAQRSYVTWPHGWAALCLSIIHSSVTLRNYSGPRRLLWYGIVHWCNDLKGSHFWWICLSSYSTHINRWNSNILSKKCLGSSTCWFLFEEKWKMTTMSTFFFTILRNAPIFEDPPFADEIQFWVCVWFAITHPWLSVMMNGSVLCNQIFLDMGGGEGGRETHTSCSKDGQFLNTSVIAFQIEGYKQMLIAKKAIEDMQMVYKMFR